MSVDEIVNGILENMPDDGHANYIQLKEQLDLVGTITSIILGLIVTIIVVGVPVVVALELCYINIPVFQEYTEKIIIKTTGKLNTAIGFVVRDAKLALQEANTIQTGKSANYIYLKIKVKSIFLATVFVAIALGAGPSIVHIVVNITQAILEGFRSTM